MKVLFPLVVLFAATAYYPKTWPHRFRPTHRMNGISDSTSPRGGRLVEDTSDHQLIQVDSQYIHIGDSLFRIINATATTSEYMVYTTRRVNDPVFKESDSVTWEFQLYPLHRPDSSFHFIALGRRPIIYHGIPHMTRSGEYLEEGKHIINTFGHYYYTLVRAPEGIISK